jgi:hypothetical protein
MAEFNEVFPAYQPRLQPRDEGDDFSKRVVIFSIAAIMLYTAVVLFFTWHGKFVPDSLTYSYFGSFAVELSAIAGIKINKTKGGLM